MTKSYVYRNLDGGRLEPTIGEVAEALGISVRTLHYVLAELRRDAELVELLQEDELDVRRVMAWLSPADLEGLAYQRARLKRRPEERVALLKEVIIDLYLD